jgi:hypothetical protein
MVPQQLDGFHGKSRKNGDLGVPPHDLGHLQSGDLRVKQCHVYHPFSWEWLTS